MAKNSFVRTVISVKVISLVGAASLVGAVVAEQLRRPADERTWHGTILGIPYDFRPPTPEKLRNTFWNKDTSKIFVPDAFGIGWSVNFYPIVHPKPEIDL